jgi:hypothetical protein
MNPVAELVGGYDVHYRTGPSEQWKFLKTILRNEKEALETAFWKHRGVDAQIRFTPVRGLWDDAPI